MATNGTAAPKFVYNYGLTGAVTVNLDYAFDVNVDYETSYIEHESAITLERDAYKIGKHAKVTMNLNLHKYVSPTAAQKLTTLLSYEGLKVSLWQHRDGNPFFKDLSGNTALFMLKEVIPFHLEDVNFKDCVKLVFESMNKVVLNPTYVP